MSVEFKTRIPDIGETKAAITITHASADTNQAGANHPCIRAIVKAFTTNTGLVWLDFGAAAVDGACMPLDAGESISVPVTNTNKLNCLFKVGGEKVTVAYSN